LVIYAPSGSGVQALNTSPTISYKTSPQTSPGNPYPVITGIAPLTVKFNLCPSEDPDPGDSLNWQFHFGDDGTSAFRPDGSFNPNFDHFCRTEHTYGEGTFVATLSVTDKHLEDQSHGAVSLARRTERITIRSLTFPPPASECVVSVDTFSATGSISSPTCTCPATGTTLPFFLAANDFATACFAKGGSIAKWSLGGTCQCLASGPV